jgi:NAD(P)-dependent dehydrogenase (short-subunit alcohol dehydrogenase family)
MIGSMKKSLTGKVALVAGATRGAGRGIAVQLGAAGATVYVTGRTGRSKRSEMNRPETIEETAALVDEAGGHGIAVIKTPGGLVVEVTDGTEEYNATRYRVSFFYDLAKAAVNRMAFALAHDLEPYAATAVSLTPGWLRSEMMLEAYGVTESNWRDATKRSPHFAISESPAFVGRAVAALAQDPNVSRWNGKSLSSRQPAKIYRFTDLDGSQPDAWRYVSEVQDAGKPADVTGYR